MTIRKTKIQGFLSKNSSSYTSFICRATSKKGQLFLDDQIYLAEIDEFATLNF